MLEDNSGVELAGRSTRECKPNYELMITRKKEKLELNNNFQNAIFEYMGDIKLKNKIAELVGELVSEERQIKKSIENLMSEQEQG